MPIRVALPILLALLTAPITGQSPEARPGEAAPLNIGETFTLASASLGETRRINVYLPPPYHDGKDARLPVLYMPDGGIAEDFLHIAGLVQISVANGTMRPFILVGIENTQRRRDLTGPTTNPEDRKIAPQVGGSAAFRTFIRAELMPAITSRYRTTSETAIVGESLAGLFVIETLLVEPALFGTYIAFDPSLWWNKEQHVLAAAERLRQLPAGKTLYLATSDEKELVRVGAAFARQVKEHAGSRLASHYEPLPGETHGSIYHPAALRAFRHLFAPTKAPEEK